MRRGFITIFISLVVFIVIMLNSKEIYAAQKYVTKHKYTTNGIIEVYTKSGKYIDTISVDDYNVDSFISFVGDVAYFTVSDTYRNNNYLYKKNIKTKEQEMIYVFPSTYRLWSVNDVYNGSLYISAGEPSDISVCYRYYIKTNKMVKIANGAYQRRSGKYIYCNSAAYSGSVVSFDLYQYNSKLKKTVTLVKSCRSYNVTGKYVYYAIDLKSKKAQTRIFTIKKYNINTGTRTTLMKQLRATEISKITDKNIYYYISNYSGEPKYFRYSLVSRKKYQLSSDKFYELLRK